MKNEDANKKTKKERETLEERTIEEESREPTTVWDNEIGDPHHISER